MKKLSSLIALIIFTSFAWTSVHLETTDSLRCEETEIMQREAEVLAPQKVFIDALTLLNTVAFDLQPKLCLIFERLVDFSIEPLLSFVRGSTSPRGPPASKNL